MWEPVERSVFRGGGARNGRRCPVVKAARPLVFTEDDVSLGLWGQLAIYKGWGHLGACLDYGAAFPRGLSPRSPRDRLEKGQKPLQGWPALPQPLAGPGLKTIRATETHQARDPGSWVSLWLSLGGSVWPGFVVHSLVDAGQYPGPQNVQWAARWADETRRPSPALEGP